MTSPKTTKVFEREATPWPLPNTVTAGVCLLAGREASAALRIALAQGKHAGATAAHEPIFYEPFTYWDWHAVGPDDTYARDHKRQRVWEHQRGFVVNDATPYGYPTSRERWAAFKREIEKEERRKTWVKRIAVANWMDAKDLVWYVSHYER